MTPESVLEMHFGSDYYELEERGDLKHIIAAMHEYAKHYHAEKIKELLPSEEEIELPYIFGDNPTKHQEGRIVGFKEGIDFVKNFIINKIKQ